MADYPNFPNRISVIDCPFMGAPLSLYLIHAHNKLILIDSGIHETPQLYLFPFLQAKGFTPQHISMVILTHAHHDHFGGNGEIYQHNPSVIFAANWRETAWIEDSRLHFREMYRIFPNEWEPDDEYQRTVLEMCGESVAVAKILKDNELIHLDDGTVLHCLPAPSHSKGHIMLLSEQLHSCFTGDAIQGAGTRLASGLSVFPLYSELDEYLATLERIQHLNVEWMCTGHYGVLNKERTSQLIHLSKKFVLLHSEYTRNVLHKSSVPLSLHQIVRQLHSLYYMDYELAYQLHATTYAHLQHLLTHGEAAQFSERGRMLWVKS